MAAAASPPAAATVGFDCITDSSASNCTIGEAQLEMESIDEGSSPIRFSFTNTGATRAIIFDLIGGFTFPDDSSRRRAAARIANQGRSGERSRPE